MGGQEIRKIWSRHFSPLQMLELDACTRCLECVDACPVIRAGYPDGAMERIAGWRRLVAPQARILSRLTGTPIVENGEAALFSSLFRCTSCGACSVVCESGIATVPLWESIMGAGREMGFLDPAIEQMARTIIDKKSPYGDPRADRVAWIPTGIPVADAAPVALFTGCTVAFRQPAIGQAALRILAKSGTEFCMVQEESCCGSFLFRTGSSEEYAGTIRAMIEDLRARGVRTLLVTCAGCLKTITVDWPCVYGKELPFVTMPFAAFVRELIRQKKIQFRPLPHQRVVYHDPCHAGRHLVHHLGPDLAFEAPRDLLRAMPGVELLEYEKNRKNQVCCGAGGGTRTRHPELAIAIAKEKISAADRMDAGILASVCPFCRKNLEDTRVIVGSSIEVLDLIQLVDRMMDSL